MSDFFKAALKCDEKAAEQAPMFIDRRQLIEDVFRHEQLVQQTLANERLLHDLEVAHRQERERQQAQQDEEKAHQETKQAHAAVYKAPPHGTQHLQPEERNPGARAIERALNGRANLWRQNLSLSSDSVREHEGKENTYESRLQNDRERAAERQLSAAAVAHQLAAREAELSQMRFAAETEQRKRRVHPIDVLHSRIAAELATDLAEGAVALSEQLLVETKPIEATYEDEQLRSLKRPLNSHSMHIPSAVNVGH